MGPRDRDRGGQPFGRRAGRGAEPGGQRRQRSTCRPTTPSSRRWRRCSRLGSTTRFRSSPATPTRWTAARSARSASTTTKIGRQTGEVVVEVLNGADPGSIPGRIAMGSDLVVNPGAAAENGHRDPAGGDRPGDPRRRVRRSRQARRGIGRFLANSAPPPAAGASFPCHGPAPGSSPEWRRGVPPTTDRLDHEFRGLPWARSRSGWSTGLIADRRVPRPFAILNFPPT